MIRTDGQPTIAWDRSIDPHLKPLPDPEPPRRVTVLLDEREIGVLLDGLDEVARYDLAPEALVQALYDKLYALLGVPT